VTDPAARADPAAHARPAEPTAPWRRPAYRRLCAAVVVSQIGDWLLFIALPLYVLRASGSALSTAMVFLAELLPAVVVGTAGGPLIDRGDPARLLAALTSLQAVILLPLLWAGPGSLSMVYVVAALAAAASSITVPAQQAMVPRLVAARDLSSANATVEMASNAARLIGSPLGGALLPVLGLRGLVMGDMASFLIAAVLLLGCTRATSMRTGRPRPAPPTGRLIAVAEGWKVVRESPTLRSALVISFVASIAQGLFLVLFVLFVIRLLHGGDQLVGLLRGVQAVGGVLGGVLVATCARHLRARTQAVWGLLVFGLVALVSWNSPAFTTSAGWYVALFVAVGVPATAISAGLITGAQQASPPAKLGRVLSLNQVAEALGQGTGILAAGLLGGAIPLTVLLNAQAGCYLMCAVIAGIGFARRAPG
jgi:Na+/melibiose symporter-like transporter